MSVVAVWGVSLGPGGVSVVLAVGVGYCQKVPSARGYLAELYKVPHAEPN